jgi:hypothetical protein
MIDAEMNIAHETDKRTPEVRRFRWNSVLRCYLTEFLLPRLKRPERMIINVTMSPTPGNVSRHLKDRTLGMGGIGILVSP